MDNFLTKAANRSTLSPSDCKSRPIGDPGGKHCVCHNGAHGFASVMSGVITELTGLRLHVRGPNGAHGFASVMSGVLTALTGLRLSCPGS